MDYNYDPNAARRHSSNQAATPYSRPQEKRYVSNMGRSMVNSQDRHPIREHISTRYGNVLDDLPQQNAGIPGMPQTPARSTFTRPRFQTPFAAGISRPGSPHVVVPRTPYSTDMDSVMMPIGSPTTPRPLYSQYEQMGHYDTSGSRYGRRPLEQFIYDDYTELNESPLDPRDYNRTVLQSVPQEFPASFKNTSPQAYGAFLRGAHQFPSPKVQGKHYEEPNGVANSYMKSTQLISNTRHYLNEPMEESVGDVKFAKLSIEKDPNERALTSIKQKLPTTPGPVMMSKKVQEPTLGSIKDSNDKQIVLCGPIEKVFKWDELLNSNTMTLYETIGPLVQVRQGERPDEKVILLRDVSTPVLQCVFSEVDRRLPHLQPGQLVRCVGKMISSTKMRGFSVRAATEAEKKCLLRLSFIVNRVVNELTVNAKKNENIEPSLGRE